MSAIPSGSAQQVLGVTVLVATGFGLGWVNVGADYSRYLPRRSSGGAVVWWTTFGASIAPLFLLTFGLLLAGSSKNLLTAINTDPIGALSTILPTWYLIPFVIVAVLGLVGGAVLDIYSSGLTLLAAGLRVPRWSAALIDGALMIAGTIYVVFFSSNFIGPFEGFLITLGVPISAWCGVMLADILLRRSAYSDADLFSSSGRYGSIRWVPAIRWWRALWLAGLWSPAATPPGCPGRDICSDRSGSAARRGPGRSRTSGRDRGAGDRLRGLARLRPHLHPPPGGGARRPGNRHRRMDRLRGRSGLAARRWGRRRGS